MTSRKAQKRDDNSSTESIKHSTIEFGPAWPQFYRLYEHERFHTIICLPDLNSLLEVEQLMQKGNEACTHRDQLHDCIRIEKTTIDEWLSTHPPDR